MSGGLVQGGLTMQVKFWRIIQKIIILLLIRGGNQRRLAF
jgi:hypothetical protein